MPNHMYETRFLVALLATLVIETALLFLVVRLLFRIPGSLLGNGLVLFTGILSSVATLPYVWFVLPAFIHSFRPYVLTAESLVLIVEAIIFSVLLRLNLARALAASAICNAASFVVGEIMKAGGWPN